ncbi:MAG: heterodisulfide reductase-related iron-sulfur binding cluster [Spirochaetia bacterium]|nr:heterodisulfide reductase-related iron-sulfur binding cluster [Spirochaetia bacterium]
MTDYIIHFIHTAVFFTAVIVFFRSVNYRLKTAQKGQAEKIAPIATGIRSFILNVIFQEKLFKEPLRGIMHAFIFYGFVIYSVHTLSQMTAGNIWSILASNGLNPYDFKLLDSPLPFLEGSLPSVLFFLAVILLIATITISRTLNGGKIFHPVLEVQRQWAVITALLLESAFLFSVMLFSGKEFYDNVIRIFSYLVLGGLGYFAARRWIFKSKGLDISSPQSAIVISLISILMISTLLNLSAESAVRGTENPFDLIFTPLFSLMTNQAAEGILMFSWWVHLMTVYAFMIYVPTSKHGHLIFAPINFFLLKDSPRGQMPYMDLEDENAVWGSGNVSELTWKTMLDSLSCIECGRCTNRCPANLTGKPLDPKKIMVDIKHAMMEFAPAILENKESTPAPSSLINETYIGDEELWNCTTCFACVEACPVGNNQADAILAMRKHLVLQESRFPSHLQNAFNNMERNSNPWGVASSSRADWCSDLDVKIMSEDSNVEILYWVGCAGAFDERNKNIARSFVKIMKSADINFGILGTEENCTGDSARRGGNEYLYQMLAQQNIDTMNGYGVKKIVTACPHCFNTLKNEYPQLGGNYEVLHHSQYIDSLISEGKLNCNFQKTDLSKKKSTFHDSCYLGRHNEIYMNPRNIMNRASGTMVEPCDTKSESLCCGAGGAQMWMEEQHEKVNQKRTTQLLETGAEVIASACPFCNIMLSDGVKASSSEDVRVLDIAEIVAEALE